MSDDNLNSAIAHLVLCGVSAQGASRMSGKNFTSPGMHMNLFVHGILGFITNQQAALNLDVKQLYDISLKASKYLPLPCLMADVYASEKPLSMLHLASGFIPLAIALSGKDNENLGRTMILCNILSLIYYSVEKEREWGFYTAGAAVFAYFMAPKTGQKLMYPLGLALMEYCAYRVYSSIYFTTIGPGRN